MNNHLEHLVKALEDGTLDFYEEKDEAPIACVQCGECCHNREDILLSPFDLYNLVQATGKDVETILEKYTDMFVGKNSHVPIVRLRYRQEPDGTTTCYFLGRKDGKAYCRVQSHKPTVCRIYPFGKLGSFAKDKTDEESEEKIRYFLQEINGCCDCKGINHARECGEKHRLLEWVGGCETKRLSDKYSVIFNRFMTKYTRLLNKRSPEKRWDRITVRAFYEGSARLIYTAYDYTVTPDEFLEVLERNLNAVFTMAETLVNDPQFFKKEAKKRFKEMLSSENSTHADKEQKNQSA